MFVYLLSLLFLTMSPSHAVDLQYESCTAKNDYINTAILQEAKSLASQPSAVEICEALSDVQKPLPIRDLHSVARDLSREREFPVHCVLDSLKSAPQASHTFLYGECGKHETGSARTRHVSKPCTSQLYTSFVYHSFVDSMQCLGINPKEIFPLMGHESGLQINLGNKEYNWGVGQITPSAVNRLNWSQVTAPLRAKPECSAMKGEFDHSMSKHVRSCELISMPENPMRNFLYAGILYQQFRSMAQNAVAQFQQKRIAQKRPGLTDKEKQNLIVDLTRKMYNGGPTAVLSSFRAFSQESTNAPLVSFIPNFNKWLGSNFGAGIPYYKSRKKVLQTMRRNVPNYANQVSNYSSTILKTSANECGN